MDPIRNLVLTAEGLSAIDREFERVPWSPCVQRRVGRREGRGAAHPRTPEVLAPPGDVGESARGRDIGPLAVSNGEMAPQRVHGFETLSSTVARAAGVVSCC